MLFHVLKKSWEKKTKYQKTKIYRAIITVPTTALVEQWKKECGKFNFKNIITVSSKENWDKNLAFFNTASKLIDTSYIVIVTYASLPRPRFQSYFTQLPKDTILIADETHNLGSQGLLRLLPNIHLEKRIGLSATPHRKFDETGNQAIQEFFDDEPPYIVSYSMEEALNVGWLCKYTYHPHIVKLTDPEMKKYKELSLQLLRMGLFDKDTGSFRSTPEIEKKLLERKRIIHKAANKLDAFKDILKIEFEKQSGRQIFRVWDNGFGMQPDILGQIFGMYFRGSVYSKGNGLGLYLVKKSVDKLRGKISVSSKPGQSTTFTIMIPDAN